MFKRNLLMGFLLTIFSVSLLLGGDIEITVAPEGSINTSGEAIEEANSWITVLTLGNAPGMDEYRWADEDFGWAYNFDVSCKEIMELKLWIQAWDVDYAEGERDAVWVNGVKIGYLYGVDEQWRMTQFLIDPSILIESNGVLKVWIDIDETEGDWALTIDYSKLAVHWDWSVPVAAFSATPTEGIDDVCVQFTNLSVCGKKFLWDFGDATTSTEKNPTHCYSWTKKYYTVKLTAYNGYTYSGAEMKTDTIIKENYITVYCGTQVAYMPSVVAGLPELAVSFTNNSGGNASHFEWDYGDGTVEKFIHGTMAKEKIHPTHTYEKEGLYTVKLKGYGHGGEDIMEVKQVILVDKKFAALELISSGAPMDTCVGWECAIDQNAMLLDKQLHVKPGDDAWAVFGFADTIARKIDKIRICANNVLGSCYIGHELKDFQIMTSMNGVDFTDCMCGTIECHCGFDTYNKFTPVEAKYIKIALKNARDKNAPCIALHEIQVFGDKVTIAPMAKGIVADNEISTVTDFMLSQNYPNPFNPVTMINVNLPNSEYVTLKVYNIQGQEVASLVDGQMETGQHRIAFDASKLQSGTYIYEMKAGQFRDIKRMIFIK